MSQPGREFDELGMLAAELCEGEITPSQAARLEQLASQSSEARRFLLRYVQLHGELYWENAASAGLEVQAVAEQRPPATDPALPRRGRDRARMPYAWIVAAAMAASLLLAAYWGVSSYRHRAGEPDGPSESIAMARLVRSYEARWGEGHAIVDGEDLVGGRQLELRAGLAEIRFNCGAQLILQGPASLRLLAPAQANLVSGSLTAEVTAHVTGPGAGFVIYTPNAAIVHRGTSFGVSFDRDAGKTEVHVFEGAVGVRPRLNRSQEADWHEIARGQAVCVDRPPGAETPTVHEIPVDSGRYVRHFPTPGSVAALRALVARHPRLTHHYTFEGVTQTDKCRDKKGDLDLVEAVMLKGSGGGQVEYSLPGVDGTTEAVRTYRAPGKAEGNTVGVGLQSEAKPTTQTEARFVPPPAFTVELLLRFESPAGLADGEVSAAVATRQSERECGFLVAAVDQGRLVHLMNRDALWVESQTDCTPGDWYYVASTFRVQKGRTLINTYMADIDRGERELRHVVEDQVASGEPAAGLLGIGKGFDADLAHAYPWCGSLDEIAIYDDALDSETLQRHLGALVGLGK
jgi:hypothetical protein